MATKSKIKILIVDDHQLVRFGVGSLLANADNIVVIGEADSGEDAVTKAKELKPDIVLMDINMPGLGGMEATRKILRQSDQVKIIIVSVIETEPFPSRLLQLGARGYLSKDSTPNELKDAIQTVYDGERYLNPKIAQQLALQHLSDNSEKPFESLSDRELQVMQMIINGVKAPDVAEQLCLSSKTVNSYRYRVFNKLNVKSDVELTHMALKYGFLKLDELTKSAVGNISKSQSESKTKEDTAAKNKKAAAG
jgi:two-component system, NarL family, invasion response regulator UvrY